MNNRTFVTGLFCAACLSVCNLAHAAETQNANRTVRSQEVLDLAMKNNPSLQAAVSAEARAQESVKAAEGIYPYVFEADTGYTHSSSPLGNSLYNRQDGLSLGAGVSKTFSVGTAADFRLEGQWYKATYPASNATNAPLSDPNSDPNWGLTARLTLSQPLLRGFGNRVGLSTLRQAKEDKSLAQKSADVSASELAQAVLSAYWELWYAAKTVEINTRSRDIAKEQLEEISQRVASGDAAPVDKLAVQTRLATLEETVIESEAEVRRLQMLLSAQAGVIREHPLLVPDTEESLPVVENSQQLNDIIQQSLTESPSIQEAFAAVSASEEKARIAGESMRQRLDLTGWIEARTLGADEISPVVTDLGRSGAYSGYIGLIYELPLDNRKKEGDRAQARLDVEIAAKQLQSAENTVRKDAAVAYDSLLTAQKRLTMAEETLALAEAQAEAERERYRLGASIFTTVRDAEESVREAELRLTRARVDIVLAQIDLDNLTGNLLKRVATKQ